MASTRLGAKIVNPICMWATTRPNARTAYPTMMIGTWMASQGVPASTGAMGWMNRSMGRRSVSAMVSVAMTAAFRTTTRLRSNT